MNIRKRNLALFTIIILASLGGCTQKGAVTEKSIMMQMKAGESRDFSVNGMKVIFKKVEGNQVVSAQLYLLGGSTETPAEEAGIENFILSVAQNGSAKYSKDEVNDHLARTGAIISSAANNDYTTFSLRCLTRDFDQLWDVYTDALFNPALDPSEVELIRERRTSAIRQAQADPDAWLRVLADSVFYMGAQYQVQPDGTELSISGITLEDMVRYHTDKFVTSRMLLVVVGNLTLDGLKSKVETSFGSQTTGMYKAKMPSDPHMAAASHLKVVERDLPTNYIRGQFSAPSMSSPDYQAMQIASSILRQRLFEEVRTNRGLSYAVASSLGNRISNYGYIYVTAVEPDTTLRVMLKEVRRIQEEAINEKELRDKINVFTTRYYTQNETNAAQATLLASHEIKGGGYRNAENIVNDLKKVTPDDVLRVTGKYMRNFNFVVLGDPSKIDADLFTSQ